MRVFKKGDTVYFVEGMNSIREGVIVKNNGVRAGSYNVEFIKDKNKYVQIKSSSGLYDSIDEVKKKVLTSLESTIDRYERNIKSSKESIKKYKIQMKEVKKFK